MGQLVETQKTGLATAQFLYAGDRLIGEYDASDNLTRRYVHGGSMDEPIAWLEGDDTSDRRWLLADERGSIVGVTDASGGVLAINTYDAYGKPGSQNLGRFQYTGQTFITEVGLYHYKARFYSPDLGRFMQTDPIWYEDQTNLYMYVANDPVNLNDPTGLNAKRKQSQGACHNGGSCKKPMVLQIGIEGEVVKRIGGGTSVGLITGTNADGHEVSGYYRDVKASAGEDSGLSISVKITEGTIEDIQNDQSSSLEVDLGVVTIEPGVTNTGNKSFGVEVGLGPPGGSANRTSTEVTIIETPHGASIRKEQREPEEQQRSCERNDESSSVC